MDIVALTQRHRSPWHQAGGSATGARAAGGLAERIVEGEVLGGRDGGPARGWVPPRDAGYAAPLPRGLAAYLDNAMLAAPRRRGMVDCYA